MCLQMHQLLSALVLLLCYPVLLPVFSSTLLLSIVSTNKLPADTQHNSTKSALIT